MRNIIKIHDVILTYFWNLMTFTTSTCLQVHNLSCKSILLPLLEDIGYLKYLFLSLQHSTLKSVGKWSYINEFFRKIQLLLKTEKLICESHHPYDIQNIFVLIILVKISKYIPTQVVAFCQEIIYVVGLHHCCNAIHSFYLTLT